MMKFIKQFINPAVLLKLKRIAGFIDRLSVYSAPFILCVLAIIHGILFISGYKGLFLYITGEVTGHSIFVIYIIRIFTRKMCKWYKRSCNILILYHVINIIDYILIFKYGKSIFNPHTLIYSTLIFSTIALLSWFISDTCKKTIKLIYQVYKRAQK